jgi:hypothetical protein
MVLIETRAPYQVPYYPDMVGVHLLISWPAAGVLEHFFQKLHKKVQVNRLSGFLSWILESVALLPQVNLCLQRNNSTG